MLISRYPSDIQVWVSSKQLAKQVWSSVEWLGLETKISERSWLLQSRTWVRPHGRSGNEGQQAHSWALAHSIIQKSSWGREWDMGPRRRSKTTGDKEGKKECSKGEGVGVCAKGPEWISKMTTTDRWGRQMKVAGEAGKSSTHGAMGRGLTGVRSEEQGAMGR